MDPSAEGTAAQLRRIAELDRDVARYRRLVDNVPGMVYQFVLRPDATMGFTFASEGSLEIYGHAPAAIMQDYRLVFERVAAEDVTSFMASVRRSAATLSAYKWEGRITREGRTRWIQAASRPQAQADGSILWDGVILDITQRKEADAALERVVRQEATIAAQAELLAQLSTPLIPVTDEALVLPLIGEIDGARATRIVEALLSGVERGRVTTVIVDLTGLTTMSAGTAATLASAARGMRLLGVSTILTGIRPEVAQTMVAIDVDLSRVETLASVQEAVARVLERRRPRGGR